MISSNDAPDLVLRRGLFTTLDRSNPAASAVAIKNGVFTAVGRDEDIVPLARGDTKFIDLKARRALPGLIDNHLHIIRGGLNFNMELRWDGVRSLADACGDTSPEAHERATQRLIQAGAAPLTTLQFVFELQQDWARAGTYDGVMGILKDLTPYGIQVRFSKWALGEHASEAGPAPRRG